MYTAILRNGDLASGSVDKTIKVWSESEVHNKIFKYHNSGICSLVVLPNGDLASGSTWPENCI